MAYFIFALLIFILTILILVSVHEWGHLIAAKFCRIKVLRFSIGFGKPWWRFYRDAQGTDYVLAPIPLGGYVKLLDEREAPVAAAELSYAFNRHSVYQRLAVVAAGVIANILLAILAFWLVFSVGITVMRPVIGSVLPNSLAAAAGIKANEEIIAIDDRPTPHWPAVAMALVSHYGESGKLTLTVQQANHAGLKSATLNINLHDWVLNGLRPDPLHSLGIVPAHTPLLRTLQYPIWTAAIVSLQQTFAFIKFNFVVIKKMLTGVLSWHGLGGPISIFNAAALSAGQGIIIYINFLALLSISIAVINLLPLPGLDGAQLVYLLIELVRKKPVSVAVQILLFRLGVILLFLLMFQVIMNDLLRL